MNIQLLDYLFIAGFLGFVLYIVISNLIKKQSTSSYFRGGANVHWSLIGFSIVAADMTLSYVVELSSNGYKEGIATGSYEWTASITMIVVALYILPRFMALGVLTLPEYLEMRYNSTLRFMVSVLIIIGHIISGLATSFYVSGMLFTEYFSLDHQGLIIFIWATGFITCSIIVSGGLSALVRTDAAIVILLLIAGLIVAALCMIKIDGFANFMAQSDNRMHAVLPASHPKLPWTQVFLGSLWIMHLYYWGFNQFIVQNTLAADSLSTAQKGVLLAATIKLIIPFLFFIPGIVGYELFKNEALEGGKILPLVLKQIVPNGVKGFILMAYLATAIGATNAILNACSTIFSNDIYKRFFNPKASDKSIILVSRISVVAIVCLACILAPKLDHLSIFDYSQYISASIAPILASIFIFGLYVKRTPAAGAIAGLLITLPIYFTILLIKNSADPTIHLLGYMINLKQLSSLQLAGMNFLLTSTILFLATLLYPVQNPVDLKGKRNIRFERNLIVVIWGIFIFTLTATIYMLFL